MELPANYNKLTREEKKLCREKYITRQISKCYYCKHPLDKDPPSEISGRYINKNLFPEKFFDYPIHLHHGHGNGLTIGAVHAYCNAILWQYHGE